MRINNIWVGWALGDESKNDMTVRKAKSFMRLKFKSYAGHLVDTNKFDLEFELVVKEMQDRYVNSGKLTPGQFYYGVLDLPTQIAMGFKQQPFKAQRLPLIFTVEGHMSDKFVGPTAYIASTLEAEGRCHWRPTGYDCTALPFNNKSGWESLAERLGTKVFDDGVLFPPGTPWELIGFSQGGIVVCEFMMRYVLPPNAPLHYRLKDFRRGLALGNPYRENNMIAPWVPDPPKPNTQGISDKLFNTSKIVLPDGRRLSDIWMEHSRHGDLYAENQLGEVGLNKTAVYKMVQAEFTGNPASILARLWDTFTDPIPGLIDITKSVIEGGMFLANMGPHGMYDLNPCVNWMREGLAT